jgi:radical SAM protein with 4Fe4S-binding SPASM domain
VGPGILPRVVELVSGMRRARFALSYYLRMRRGRRAVLDHLEGTAPVPMPTFVQLRVTNLCNLRCRMCGQWGDTGVFREHKGDGATDGEAERARIRELIGLKRQLALGDYVRLLDELAPHRPIVSLFGGEPFLYPDLMPLVRAIKGRGLVATVITNGWHLERHARELVEAGMDSIAVSIDGPPAVHDRIRGRESSFARAAAGIRAVARWRRELGRALPVQMAILPITELNASDVQDALDALRELPLELVNVGLRWFVPPAAGAQYERVMRESFGVDAPSWRGFEFTWPQGAVANRTMQGVVSVLKAARGRRLLDLHRGRPWVSFVPGVSAADVPAYFSQPSRTFGHDLCPVAWYFAQVEPDGDVCFCGDFPDFVLGNVRRESFTSVWKGDRARSFREKLAREPLPICARCCGSYVYGKWPRPRAAAPRGSATAAL